MEQARRRVCDVCHTQRRTTRTRRGGERDVPLLHYSTSLSCAVRIDRQGDASSNIYDLFCFLFFGIPSSSSKNLSAFFFLLSSTPHELDYGHHSSTPQAQNTGIVDTTSIIIQRNLKMIISHTDRKRNYSRSTREQNGISNGCIDAKC